MQKALISILSFLLSLHSFGQNISLNGQWSFKIDPRNKGEREQWYDPQRSVSGWDVMPVPGNWQLSPPYEDYSGKAWYRKQFITPTSSPTQEVVLEFEAVFHDSKVWLNGEYLGASNSGFFSFEFVITELLKPGENNVLVVMVDNTFRIGAMWNWGGIRRPVTVHVKSKTNVQSLFVAATPDLNHNTAEVVAKALLYNTETNAKVINASLKISFAGEEMAVKDIKVNLPPGDSVPVEYRFSLSKAQTFLWHFDFPNQYDVELILKDDLGNTICKKEDRFGIRKLEVRGFDLLLNGEPVRLVGFNYVPDDRITGNTLPAWRYKADIDMMKSAGANMARLSHLPLPEEVLDYLDEKGIMHYAEIPLWGSDNSMVNPDHPIPKRWLEKMIVLQFNHPSIIGWSVGNEIGFNPRAVSYVRSAVGYVRENLDTTRLINDVSHSAGKNRVDAAEYAKIIFFNAYGAKWLGSAVADVHRNHPGKPIFMSEFGDALNADDPNTDNLPIKKMMDTLRAKSYVVGASLWTFNDYRSIFQSADKDWSTPASENRPWGVVNIHRQKKRVYEDVRKEFAPVRSLRLNIEGNEAAITVEPRQVRDLPAYTLRNYYLMFEAYNKTNVVLDSRVEPLPTIKPGDPAFTIHIKTVRGAAKYTVALYNPLHYRVLDTTLFFAPPTSPKVKEIQPGRDVIRIYFKRPKNALEVFARFVIDGKTAVTAPTINDFIDVPASPDALPVDVTLVARNSFGESLNNDPITVKSSFSHLPPVIYTTGSIDNGFTIGYESEETDYLYQVEYQILPDSTVYQEQSPSRGVMIINGLPEGKEVKFRLRKLDQTNAATAWSMYHKVTTGYPKGEKEISLIASSKIKKHTVATGRLTQPEPLTVGAIPHGDFWLLRFEAVQFARSYKVKFYDANGNEVYSELINRGWSESYIVPTQKTGKAISVKVFAQYE